MSETILTVALMLLAVIFTDGEYEYLEFGVISRG